MEKSLELKSVSTLDKSKLIAGIVTGQVAGLIMAVVVIAVFMIFFGKPFYYPVQVIGSTLFGEAALDGNFHFGAFLTGLILHQGGPSLLWGTIFGLFGEKLGIKNKSKALSYGVLFGVVTMFGPYVLIPAVMNLFQGVDLWNREVPILWDWAAHIVFGASFILYPYFAKKLSK